MGFIVFVLEMTHIISNTSLSVYCRKKSVFANTSYLRSVICYKTNSFQRYFFFYNKVYLHNIFIFCMKNKQKKDVLLRKMSLNHNKMKFRTVLNVCFYKILILDYS